jgi:hypothetical protein
MKKGIAPQNRVLARRLARQLSVDELRKSSGNGTSYRSTDYGYDVEACDCCIGPDRMVQ